MNSNWVRRIGISSLVSAVVLFILLASGHSAMAQSVFGQILGTVTDATGAAVPNAIVTVTDVAKGTVVNLQSNGAGEFTADHLIPDTYNIKVAATGFKGFEQKGLQVFADTSPSVKAVLAVGASDQVVEVNADAVAQLKTDRADVATVFNAQEIEDLPIPDHNFTNLQLLLPGAVQLGWAHAASENPQGSKQIQIDGQAFGGVNYTLDGTDNQDPILGIIVINPNYESMSEAKIATQNFDAEFGKAVASVETVQTKSGTNSFHGSLFDNRESNANLARDPFTVTKAQGYPTGLKNQFGASIGGPVLKDKIFFFGDYQGVRQKSGASGIGTVPSMLAMQSCTGATVASNGQPGCDFSQYLNVGGNHQLYDNSTGTPIPYANNIIPLNRLSPQAVNLFKLLLANGKTPNNFSTNNGLQNNYAGTGTGIFNSNQWDVRGDATLSQKIHVFGRFSRFTDTLSGASLFGPAGGPGLGIAGFGGVSTGANDSLAMGTDIAINSKLVTDVRLGYFRYNIITHKNDPGNTNLPFIGQNVSGSSPSLAVPTNFGTPDIDIADVGSTTPLGFLSNDNTQNSGPQFGSGLNMNHCNCPLKEKEDQFQVVNNWTKTIGNHAVKFGVDLRYARNLRVPSDSDRTGLDKFANAPTSNGITGGLGFASFILGDVSSIARYTSVSTNAKEFQVRDFFYAQDTWRATPKLTLNIGARYEFYGPERVNGAGNGALLNLQTGYINVAGSGPVPLNMGVGAAKNAWNPRLGVAYQLNDKTVIRGGYGRSFDLGVFGSEFGHVVTQNIPVLANQSLSGTGGNTSYAFNLSDPTNTAVPGVGKPANATSPLTSFTPPAPNSNGQIPINAVIPGTGGSTIGGSVNVKARPFTERLPTLDAWNFAVQRSITPTLSAEVAYVGNKGTHTLSDGDGNNTNPNEAAITLPASFNKVTNQALHYDPAGGTCLTGTAGCTAANAVGSSGATSNSTLLQRYTNGNLPACGSGPCNWTQGISYYGNDQDTHYNALQVKVTKTYSRGLSVSGNFAYQVGSDASSNFATWDKQAVISNDQAIRRKAFTAYGLYKLPFGKNQMFLNNNSVLNYIVGGWELSPVVAWQSGLPFSLSYSECGASIPGDAPCQPNGNVGSLKTSVTGVPGTPSGVSFFSPVSNICGASNTSGFTCPGLDTIGSIKRNTAWGPRFFNSDVSISKNVTFHERYTAQFRMDAFNAFNHINLGNPNGNIDSSGAGSIGGGPYPAGLGGTTNPRQLQFTLHFAF
jgi:outer membrane receptor protein involved in Fe transport